MIALITNQNWIPYGNTGIMLPVSSILLLGNRFSPLPIAGFFFCNLVYDVINFDIFDNTQMTAPISTGISGTPATPLPHIMVVEDNPDALYLAAEILRTLGYGVQTAESGEQALSQLAAQPCDILFTDVSLPGMSGIDLARSAVARHPALRIIFATGYGEALTRGLGFPATTIRKPYDLDQLQLALAGVAGP